MRKWYQEHVVWGDKTLNLTLLRKGILTRIYAPMVIVQGLRESSIFTSIIESASTSLSKDKFLSFIESSNSTRHESVFSSRNVNRITESHATARRVLQFIDVIDEATVPPLPAPNVDENKMVESR